LILELIKNATVFSSFCDFCITTLEKGLDWWLQC